MTEVSQEVSLAERFQSLLGSSTTGGDDEKLLELASKFSLQLSASQIRILMAINLISDIAEKEGDEKGSFVLRSFSRKYLELKQYHGSDFFVMRALENVSLRKFMAQQPINVDVIKK